jgi:hypothetical protein
MALPKISKILLVAGPVIIALALFLAWGAGHISGHNIFGISPDQDEIVGAIFEIALLVGTVLILAGFLTIPTKLAPRSEMFLGLIVLATCFALPFLLKAIGKEINIHTGTSVFLLVIMIGGCAGLTFFARGYSKWGQR